MAEVIGGTNSSTYKELTELIQIGLHALRQEAPLLLWTFKSLGSFFQLDAETVSSSEYFILVNIVKTMCLLK